MELRIFFAYVLGFLLGTSALQHDLMDSMTSFKDVTSLDVSNEERELEHLMTLTDHELSNEAPRLQCYSCASTESWEDCEHNQIRVGCPKTSTRCIKGSITLKKPNGPIVTEYFKSCVSTEKCSTQHFPACLAGSKESASCSIDCCDQAFCNKEVYEGSNEVFKGSQRNDFKQLEETENKRQFSFNCQPPCLIYATATQINGIELKTSRKVQGMMSLKDVRAIDVDMVTQTLYWSDTTEHVIKRSSLLSGATEILIGGENGVYDGIAVEWIGGLLYWTDFTHKKIEVAKLDGSSRKTIIDRNVDKPRAIVVDPEQGILFFTDWGASPRLERASLSGQDRRVLISTGLSWPNGLVLDYTNKKLYICESDLDRFESINYDGSGRRVLYSAPNIHPFDLALYKTTLFWGDWQGSSIEKVDVVTGKRLPGSGVVSKDRVLGMVVLDKARQPRVTSPCSLGNGGCSHLCFTTGIRTRVCGCPNNVKLLADQRTCDLGVTTTAASRLSTTTSGLTTGEQTTTQTSTTERLTTELSTAEPSTTEQQTTTTTEQHTTEPTTTEQHTTEATTTEQHTTTTTEQHTTEPTTTEQHTTEATTTEQHTTEPTTTEQHTTEATTTEQHTTEPTTTEQHTTEPSTTEQHTTEPSTTEQQTTEPTTIKLKTTKATTTKLKTTKATTTEPTTEATTTEPTTRRPTTTQNPTTPEAKTTQQTTAMPSQSTATTKLVKTTKATTTLPTTHRQTATSQPSTKIRLANGDSPSEGRVEVKHNGKWGTICDDYWDLRDANVVCRMLGFPEAIAAFPNAYFGPGRGRIWLDDVHCLGHESDIGQCDNHGWGSNNCRHSEDAAVKCRPVNTPTPALPVRLVNGRKQHRGRVEVYHAGKWGTICDDLWDKVDADVICRMLGYPEAIAATRRATFGQGSGRIWMDNVQCMGTERSIEECTRLDWGRNNCQHSEDAGVICRPVPHTTTPPPIVTTSSSHAPVEGFAIVCLPHSMHIRISRKNLAKITSLKLNPGLLHLNDPSCGASKVSDTHVTFSTPLDACGTVRRRDGDSLTFTNKVYSQFLPESSKRVFRPPPLTFPFKCSYSRITPRDQIYAPPHAHAYKHIEQW